MPKNIEQWPSPILQESLDRKARIAIRGVFGQLGARLARDIGQQPDLEVTIGLVYPDQTAKLRGYALLYYNPHIKLKVTDPAHIEELRNKGISTELWTPEQFQNIDLTIDTTPPGKGVEFIQPTNSNGGTIFVQSGEQGIGRMTVPPKIENNDKYTDKHVFEIGDCNANAIIPVVDALYGIIDRVGINVLMQYGKPLQVLPRDETIISTYFCSSKPLQRQIKALLPEFDITIADLITQIPALRYYTHTYHIESNVPIDTGEVISLLNKHPRIKCLPHATSTYATREYGNISNTRAKLPPIVPILIRGGQPTEKRKQIDLVVTIDSRRISVLSNIDAARILLWGKDPIEAMKITDQAMDFNNTSTSPFDSSL